jgi:membrane protein
MDRTATNETRRGRGRLRQQLDRARAFFGEKIWRVQVADLPRGKAALFRLGRVLYSAGRGFVDDRLPFQAAALTYYTTLSVVPLLAFAFSVVKGFGAYGTLVRHVVRPYVERSFAHNPQLQHAIQQVLGFVTNTSVSGLGITGLALLAYTTVSMLATVESVLNRLWCFRESRAFFRRVTDYVTLVVITPILILVAFAFSAAAQSSGIVLFLRDKLSLGPVIDLALRLTGLVGACGAMTAMLLIIPNGPVRVSSAILGGVVGGFLWQMALVLYVNFQVGVAQYNALYAGFGALPIFLVWVFVSWLVFLMAAELASSHQNEQLVRQRFRAREVDQALEESFAIALMARATRAFLNGGTHPSLAERASELAAPSEKLDEIAGALIDGGVLVGAGHGNERRFSPGRDVDGIRISDVLAILRHRTHPLENPPPIERQLTPAVARILDELSEATKKAAANLTARELAARVGAAP